MTSPAAEAHSLGSYRVIRKLGAGGMAEVFLASQHMAADVERTVVIKAMLPHLADDDHFVRMFMREARVAALLSHPNIVHIHDVSVIEDRPCIIMEFLRGRDLWHLLRRTAQIQERLSPQAAAAVVAQAATGLDYAHRKRDERGRPLHLVHRDISPHNLFVTREGHVRVLDFGIAKSAYQQQRTQSGVLKGKLPYMAPEQARGGDLDGRADQFALGVVLWECLTAKRLFARDDPFQTMNALFELDVQAPSSLASDVPTELDRVVLKCLSEKPGDRFGTCAELADALRGWMRSGSAPEETSIVAAALEHAIPAEEDISFYGFDPSRTAPKVDLPLHRPVGGDIEDEETLLHSSEGTPSTSGVAPTPAARTRLLDAGRVGTATMTAEAAPSRLPVVLLALVGFALLAVVAGVVLAIALGGDSEDEPGLADVDPTGGPGQQTSSATALAAPVEIEVRFERVPEGAVVEVNGLELDGYVLRTVASDETRSIRVVRDGRQLWRYDAVFNESTDVVVPELAEAETETRTETRASSQRRRRRSGRMSVAEPTPMMRRLGTGIELDYP
jgi:serine/threonine protein kinase